MEENYEMTEEEYQELYDNFDTWWILDSVKEIDKIREHIADGENWEPPQIRSDLLKLHALAMEVVNSGLTSSSPEMFELAMELEDQILDIRESLDFIEEKLSKLNSLYPKSLSDKY